MTAGAKTSLTGTRVLVVEDEYYLADDLSRALKSVGAELVGPVGTIEDAEKKVSEGAFDAAVVNLNLRGDIAFAVAERLAEAGVPFVIATGYNMTSLPGALAGVPRIEKPFAPQQVVDLLIQLRETCG